jgi:hypothetical protein
VTKPDKTGKVVLEMSDRLLFMWEKDQIQSNDTRIAAANP